MKAKNIGFLLSLIIGFIPAVLMGNYMIIQINWLIIDDFQLLISAIFVVIFPGVLWMLSWIGIAKFALWILEKRTVEIVEK